MYYDYFKFDLLHNVKLDIVSWSFASNSDIEIIMSGMGAANKKIPDEYKNFTLLD